MYVNQAHNVNSYYNSFVVQVGILAMPFCFQKVNDLIKYLETFTNGRSYSAELS